jgi:hypothetical protein
MVLLIFVNRLNFHDASQSPYSTNSSFYTRYVELREFLMILKLTNIKSYGDKVISFQF